MCLYVCTYVADIIENDLSEEIMVGQLYNITCSAACGTHFWEINHERPSLLSSLVESEETIVQKCDRNNADCEQSNSLLPCDHAIEGERFLSTLFISFKTPGTYTIQCLSRLVFSDCDTVYTFYSRLRRLIVQGIGVYLSYRSYSMSVY